MDKAEKIIARKMREAIQSALDVDEVWALVDATISKLLEDQPEEEAQLWLSADGKHAVCVSIFGADEPLVCPFFVPEPSIPVQADFAEQVEETWDHVAALRAFARDLLKMADATNAKMVEMGLHCPDYAK